MARKKTATNRRRKTKEEARRDSELKDWIEIVGWIVNLLSGAILQCISIVTRRTE